ncbi:hypothetical protein [Viscerimonas tarda]
MNTTPKTDSCIRMLSEAQIVFSPLHYSDTGYFDKNKILDYQERVKTMLDYRLMPFCEISMPIDADKEGLETFLFKNKININNIDNLYYAMKHYPLVTANDLKNEFWGVCPNLESIPKYLDVMLVKFDDVNCGYETDINALKEQYSGLNECVKAGTINEKEADIIFLNIHFIAERYNLIMACIRGVYKEFRKMTTPEKSDTK